MATTKMPGKGPEITMSNGASDAQEAAQQPQESAMETEVQRRMAEMQRMVQDALNAGAAASAAAPQPRKNVNEASMAADEKAAFEHISGQDRVRVYLPLINKNDPEVTVTINGVRYTIQRGKKVELPAAVVEVLEHAEML